MICAFLIPRRPKSANKSPDAGYVRTLSQAARAVYAGPLLQQDLYSRIIWFHKDPDATGDADNIAKRAHDALKDVLFKDDHRITHTLSIRVKASDPVEIIPLETHATIGIELALNLADDAIQDILYIELVLQQDRRVHLGAVV